MNQPRYTRQKRQKSDAAATIGDVAKLAGVSEATVSRALRNFPQVRPELRERVRDAAAQLHYVADSNASRLASGRTRTVGLVAPQLTTWYVSQMSAGLEDVLHPSGNDLLVSALSDPARTKEIRDGHARFQQRVDAAILVDVFVGRDWSPPPNEPPTIVVGEELASGRSLGIDDALGGEMAMSHIVELGHTNIAIIGGVEPEVASSPVSALRESAAQRVIARSTANRCAQQSGMFTIEGGYAAARKLLATPDRPTALFCLSDEMAFGAMQAARELGIVIPHELTIVGFDDHSVSESIGLTTIHQPVRELGRRAADRVVATLSGDKSADAALGHEVLPIELVVRSSSAPPPR